MFGQCLQYRDRSPVPSPSFPKAQKVTSAKATKLAELVLLFVNYLIKNERNQEILKSGIERNIFQYYMAFPSNNIMHFNLSQILESILQVKSQSLISLFFVKNQNFEQILLQVLQDYSKLN